MSSVEQRLLFQVQQVAKEVRNKFRQAVAFTDSDQSDVISP